MADYQAVIQGIRATLQTDGAAAADERADLAAGYAALCRDANLRLRRCAEYAALGCYAEAAHLAACQPPLEKLVTALQFPELPEWQQLCGRLGLVQAPKLLADGWAAVSAGVAAERTFQPLLARHRALAVARAPCRERLRVARLLAKHDERNPSWPDEVRRLEAGRLGEMAAALARAAPGPDARDAALAEALAELDEQPWLSEVPDELRVALEPLARRRATESLAAELAAVAAVLLAAEPPARAPKDVAAAVARWELLEPKIESVADEDTVARVRSAVDAWRLADRQRRAAEESRMVSHMFRPQGSDPPEPAAATSVWRRRAVIVFGTLAALSVAAYLVFATNLAFAVKIRGFLQSVTAN